MLYKYKIDVSYDGCEHVADIMEWLGRHCRGAWDIATQDTDVIAMMEDHQDALLFKLTWAGTTN